MEKNWRSYHHMFVIAQHKILNKRCTGVQSPSSPSKTLRGCFEIVWMVSAESTESASERLENSYDCLVNVGVISIESAFTNYKIRRLSHNAP